ncbi:MAG: hypothetical protein M1830_004710 [Pleopsidium flavum]|nr:MAG: hypothetical protein M1830_004710 [Pleopsidium flavum]
MKRDIKAWAALGDSFASGIGAGRKIGGVGDYLCSRYDESYPYVINNDPSLGQGNRKFQNFACSGHTTLDVLNKQLSTLDKPQMVTVSAGGNDVGLADILNHCIYQWKGQANRCEGALEASEKLIDSSNFAGNLNKMLAGIKGTLADKDSLIFYPGYAKFFGIRMNGLVDKVNQKIKDAVSRAGKQVNYVDWDTHVSEHNGRFCEVNVNENERAAGNREGLVFYEWHTTADDYTDNGKDDLIYVKDGDTSKDGTFEGKIKNLMLQTVKENPGAKLNYHTQGDVNVQSGLLLPDGWGRIFHPRPLGHQIIAEKILSAMDLAKAQKNGQNSLTTKTVGCKKYAAATASTGAASGTSIPSPTVSCGPADQSNRAMDPGALKKLTGDFCGIVDFTKGTKKTTDKDTQGTSINLEFKPGSNCAAPNKGSCVSSFNSMIGTCQYNSHSYSKAASFGTTCGSYSLSINFLGGSAGSDSEIINTDQGNLKCNTGLSAGPDHYMSIEEVNNSIEVFCSRMRDASKPVFKSGGVSFQSVQTPGDHPISLSATWVEAKNCPVLDFSSHGAAAYQICKDRLNVPVNDCDTRDNNSRASKTDYWKGGGTFFRDCITWKIGKSK